MSETPEQYGNQPSEQRVIKFRAWHKKHGMIYPDEHFSLKAAITGNLDFFGSPARDFNVNDFTFMQYTGLRDKNGREVYEGDIVRYYHPEEHGLPAIVLITAVAWNADTCGFGLGYVQNQLTVYDDVEVIGNIYEHPNLLD